MRYSGARAVVVVPPVSDFYFTPGRATGLGAISVKDELEKLGLEVRVINAPLLNPRGKSIPLPQCHNHLQPYLVPGERGPLSFFSTFKYYGPDKSALITDITEDNPDFIFFSLFAYTYADDLIDLCIELKDYPQYNRAKTVIGGPGVSVLPEYFIRTGLFDYILTGEAEKEIPALFEEEIVWDGTPKVVLSSNRDKKGNYFLSTILSRGCPLKCQFCSNFLTQGREFRHCSLDELETKLKLLEIEDGYPVHLNLEDDNLLIRKSLFLSYLKLFKQYIPNLTISIDNGLDYTLLNKTLLLKLIELGFNRFTFSLGSSNAKILEEELRPANLKKFEELLYVLKEYNIPVSTFIICGLPGDNRESMLTSLLYIHTLPTMSNLSLFYTVPGLPRFEDRKRFLERSSHLCAASAAYPWGDSLTTLEMITLFRLSRLSNLLKSHNPTEREKVLLNKVVTDKKLYSFKGKSQMIVDVPQDKKLVKEFLWKISED